MPVKWDQGQLDRDISGYAEEIVEACCIETEYEIQKLFALQKHGRLYRRGRKWHQASAPNEPPAIDNGTLKQSIKHRITTKARLGGIDVVGQVGTRLTNPPYPEWLEKGTRRMAPRPWASVALEKVRARFYQIARAAVERRKGRGA